jgi:hypothetical protein
MPGYNLILFFRLRFSASFELIIIKLYVSAFTYTWHQDFTDFPSRVLK